MAAAAAARRRRMRGGGRWLSAFDFLLARSSAIQVQPPGLGNFHWGAEKRANEFKGARAHWRFHNKLAAENLENDRSRPRAPAPSEGQNKAPARRGWRRQQAEAAAAARKAPPSVLTSVQLGAQRIVVGRRNSPCVCVFARPKAPIASLAGPFGRHLFSF